jgi:hypothetical protein
LTDQKYRIIIHLPPPTGSQNSTIFCLILFRANIRDAKNVSHKVDLQAGNEQNKFELLQYLNHDKCFVLRYVILEIFGRAVFKVTEVKGGRWVKNAKSRSESEMFFLYQFSCSSMNFFFMYLSWPFFQNSCVTLFDTTYIEQNDEV